MRVHTVASALHLSPQSINLILTSRNATGELAAGTTDRGRVLSHI